jgi:formate-dependent nitrite reductase membrane component NrfD
MQTVWEWLPAVYLFLGGLGAGAFLVAATLEFSGKRYELDICPITLVGAILPGPLVALGTVLLIFDLGAGLREPWRIFYMFTHFSSVMTWGIWILSVFIPVALVYGFLEVLDTYPLVWEGMRKRIPVRRIKRIVAAVGSVFAVGTALYTGVLLSAVGPAIPFWSTSILPFLPIPMMPLLFLVSAISTGIGLTVDMSGTLALPDMQKRFRRLPVIHLALIGLEAVLLGLLLFTAFAEGGAAAQAAQGIAMGPRSLVFWILIVLLGFAFPFALHAYTLGLGRHPRLLHLGAGIGVVVAGLILRYVVLVSGIPVTL